MVVDIQLKRLAEELLMRLKPISVALDKAQSDDSSISTAVHIWADLEKALLDNAEIGLSTDDPKFLKTGKS